MEHRPEAVESWVAHLYQRFGQRPIAVAVEQSRGALAFMLSKYEPFHLFPVPSQVAANMRHALYPSEAKDDPRDADLLLDSVIAASQQATSAVAGQVRHPPSAESGGGTAQARG